MDVQFDMVEFERYAKNLGGSIDQLPYALSRSLNEAAKRTREGLISDTWPTHVKQRNPAFIKRALRIDFSTKSDLTVVVRDDLGRGHLALHADGGTKIARGRLAIPVEGIRRGAHGVPAGQRPKALIASTPKRALRITAKGIFVGKKGRLILRYALRRTAQQPADVPFRPDFVRMMRTAMMDSFPRMLADAMRTRR